jgi:phage gp29-like protein
MVAASGAQLGLPGVPGPPPPAAPKPTVPKKKAQKRPTPHPGAPPSSAEVATVSKGEFLEPISINDNEYPNLSTVLRYRSDGQWLRFYDRMLSTDADLQGFFDDLIDDVLHLPGFWRPTATVPTPEEWQHVDFAEHCFNRIRYKQAALHNILDSYARGFSVTEKVYEVESRGEWAGAVVYADLFDRPQRWFSFDLERRLRFRTAAGVFPGELVPQEKFIVTTYGSTSYPWGNPRLDLAYFPWYLKHRLLEGQALFFEKYGSPTPVAEYEWSRDEKINEENATKALEAAFSLQHDQAVAIPKGIALRLMEAYRQGSIGYESYYRQLTEMQSRLVTGQVLSSMGSTGGGSYALGKVHEKREGNKVQMLCDFLAQAITHAFRELVIRNWGPQDSYPEYFIASKPVLERQAEATVDGLMQRNGMQISLGSAYRRYQAIPPRDDADIMIPAPDVDPAQQGVVAPSLAARTRPRAIAADARDIALAFRHSRDLYAKSKKTATGVRSGLSSIGAAATKTARPAITKVVKSACAIVAKKKALEDVSKSDLYGGLKKMGGVADLGNVFESMFSRSRGFTRKLAASDPPRPAIGTTAAIALALQVVAILDRIAKAAKEGARIGVPVEDFVKSLTDPNGLAIDEAFGNLFEHVHDTDIASIEAANLRGDLSDPAWRRANPYLMVIATNPGGLDGFTDGWIVSSDAAFANPRLLPPYHFGCQCIAVPIADFEALAAGLTGTYPLGDMGAYAEGKGATASPWGGYTVGDQPVNVGMAPNFRAAGAGVHAGVTLDALREKAYALRSDDPFAWASLSAWLVWLFGVDVLKGETPQEENDVAA